MIYKINQLQYEVLIIIFCLRLVQHLYLFFFFILFFLYIKLLIIFTNLKVKFDVHEQLFLIILINLCYGIQTKKEI